MSHFWFYLIPVALLQGVLFGRLFLRIFFKSDYSLYNQTHFGGIGILLFVLGLTPIAYIVLAVYLIRVWYLAKEYFEPTDDYLQIRANKRKLKEKRQKRPGGRKSHGKAQEQSVYPTGLPFHSRKDFSFRDRIIAKFYE